MPLLFRSVCALLQALEDDAANTTKKALKGWLDQRNKDNFESWIKSHGVTITSSSVDVVAVLSAIFPQDRTDRVYSLKESSLTKIVGRSLRLGVDRIKQLDRYKIEGRGDLGACVERTVRETEHQDILNPVSLEEIDSALLQIAAKNRFSAPNIRAFANDDGTDPRKSLEAIYPRLSSVEAKWLTRMILKDYSTLDDFKSYHVLNAIDNRLVAALRLHSTYEAAVGLLRHQSDALAGQSQPIIPLRHMIGSKVGRVPYLKGRSIKNVVQLAEGRRMSVERKYDGEYCQIHINLNNGDKCIQIFSKSGKDSTSDREGLHNAIRRSLRIGQQECKFSRLCILEGELLVYNDREHKIAEFHKIRKHVSRSGSMIGIGMDSQAHEYEHLMIAYYDVLMIDDEILMNEKHAIRRRRLEETVTCARGRAILSKQKVVDFSSKDGPERLQTLLAHAFAQRWEGLVLKPSDEAYFSQRRSSLNVSTNCWIKLKKDYIPGLGDTLDFAVIGAGYDASRFAQLKNPSLKWTHFHIGCLRNKDQVKNKNAKPSFKVVAALEVSSELAKHLNQHGQFCALPFDSLKSYYDPFEIVMAPGVPNMTAVFRKPFVFDVMGAGFEKEPNRDFYTLRFPRVLKIHNDRDWKDSVSFDELQRVAKTAIKEPEDMKTCIVQWMKQLEQVDRGAKGATVPWDLSDDDVESPQKISTGRVAQPTVRRRSTRRPTEAPPLIRMDTQEMTDREIRLDSGEVAQRPHSQHSYVTNWSGSNLPTPPRSSPPAQVHIDHDRQPLSSMQSTNSTDRQRKRSIEDDYTQARAHKRSRVSPPRPQRNAPADTRISSISKHDVAESKLQQSHKSPAPRLSQPSPPKPSKQVEPDRPHTSFLVPKLSAGVAEALRFREKPQHIRDMEQTSPDRQTTADERSTQESHQTSQEALISDWQLQPAESPSPRKCGLPEIHDSYIILSPDIAHYPYLTEDLLGPAGLASRHANQVYGSNFSTMQPRPPISYYDDIVRQDIIVLIEPRRHDSSLEMLKFLIGRVSEDRYQVIWVFDWRLMEDMFARGIDDEEKLMEKRFISRFFYDEDSNMIFESSRGDVKHVPVEKIEESRRMDALFLGR